MQGFIIAGIAVSVFFIVFILSKKNLKSPDFLLILINLLMIGFLALNLLVSEYITAIRFYIQTLLPFLLFPVFFLFALETLQIKRNVWWLFLFMPFVITAIYIGADLFLLHDYQQSELYGLFNSPPPAYHILYKGNQLFFILALIWLIRKLSDYKQQLKNDYSYFDPISLQWLSRFSRIYLGITILSLFLFLFSNFGIFSFDIRTAYSIVSICTVLAIFYLSFHGIRQYSVNEYGSVKHYDAKEKYKASSLTQENQQSIYNRLLALFEDPSVYCESKLQLSDVASRLSVSTHTLSQTLNSLADKPFYDFVNSYRVRHLQKLLKDPTQKQFTILSLGFESGFNSKASLNRVFKEQTGQSPSEYQKIHLRS
jgi:AraC-like DNA-binding protein